MGIYKSENQKDVLFDIYLSLSNAYILLDIEHEAERIEDEIFNKDPMALESYPSKI